MRRPSLFMTASNSYSTATEKELFALLTQAITGSSEDKIRRVEGLEELLRRIRSHSVKNKSEAVKTLLHTGKIHGNNQPESSLICESLIIFINEYEEVFQTVLDGLSGKEQRLFLCFSKIVLSLDYNKKRKSIRSLIDFLMSRDVLNDIGVDEVQNCLISLGNGKLDKEIVKIVSPYLDSSISEICAIVFSVRLCSKFADYRLSPRMLEVIQKSMKGYFDAHYSEIERDICQFFERVRDPKGLSHLIDLLKMRHSENVNHISKAIGSILDAHPRRIDDILNVLVDTHDQNMVDAILQAFEYMKKTQPDAQNLLSKIRIEWWKLYPTEVFVRRILVRGGKLSKLVLFEILKDEKKYELALQCLKEIGISKEELSKLFPKPVMMQIYDFLYSQTRSSKVPKDLNQLWDERSKLQDNIPGNTQWFEHLLLHIFTFFNFITLNIAPLKLEGIDLVCFYPETLDLFFIGCTTGILKDNLAKMNILLKKTNNELADLFRRCSITPIVTSSEDMSISASDALYSAQNNIVVLQRDNINKLMEMLIANRKSRQVIKYIKSCRQPLHIPRPT